MAEMITVKVYAPVFCKVSLLDNDNNIQIKKGATVKNLINKLKTPLWVKVMMLAAVNNVPVKKDRVLNDGDEVMLFSPVTGG